MQSDRNLIHHQVKGHPLRGLHTHKHRSEQQRTHQLRGSQLQPRHLNLRPPLELGKPHPIHPRQTQNLSNIPLGNATLANIPLASIPLENATLGRIPLGDVALGGARWLVPERFPPRVGVLILEISGPVIQSGPAGRIIRRLCLDLMEDRCFLGAVWNLISRRCRHRGPSPQVMAASRLTTKQHHLRNSIRNGLIHRMSLPRLIHHPQTNPGHPPHHQRNHITRPIRVHTRPANLLNSLPVTIHIATPNASNIAFMLVRIVGDRFP
ncbi:hypothetical protein ACWDKQ_35400 [Saccharopolyspora sp. NPDC000995]